MLTSSLCDTEDKVCILKYERSQISKCFPMEDTFWLLGDGTPGGCWGLLGALTRRLATTHASGLSDSQPEQVSQVPPSKCKSTATPAFSLELLFPRRECVCVGACVRACVCEVKLTSWNNCVALQLLLQAR